MRNRYSIKIVVISIFMLITMTASSYKDYVNSTECDIKGIYEKVDLERGSKVVVGYGSRLEEADAVFVPIKLDVGKYEVSLKRETSNLYHIQGTAIYIETNLCTEYSMFDKAILNITSNYGYTLGEIIFL
jgi:hypothetical protein